VAPAPAAFHETVSSATSAFRETNAHLFDSLGRRRKTLPPIQLGDPIRARRS
jgi:DNA-directed RNA polymerase subunit H (RpoH/RPB5)